MLEHFTKTQGCFLLQKDGSNWIHQWRNVPVEPFAGDRGGEVSGALEIVDGWEKGSESEVEKGEQEAYLLSSNIVYV